MITMQDKLIVIGFVIVMIIITMVWSQIEITRYRKRNKALAIDFDIRCFEDDSIRLYGLGDDENSDVEVVGAIKYVLLPESVRIDPYSDEEE